MKLFDVLSWFFFLGFGTLTTFLSTVAAVLVIVFKSKELLTPELWKHLKETGIAFLQVLPMYMLYRFEC